MGFKLLPLWQNYLIFIWTFGFSQLSFGNLEDEYHDEYDYHSAENESDSVLIPEHTGKQGSQMLTPNSSTNRTARATIAKKRATLEDNQPQTYYERTPKNWNQFELDTYARILQRRHQEEELAQARQVEDSQKWSGVDTMPVFPKMPKYPKDEFSGKKQQEGHISRENDKNAPLPNTYNHGDIYPTWRPWTPRKRYWLNSGKAYIPQAVEQTDNFEPEYDLVTSNSNRGSNSAKIQPKPKVKTTFASSSILLPERPEDSEPESDTKTRNVRGNAFEDYPDTAVVGIDGHSNSNDNQVKNPKKNCNKTKNEEVPESEENPDLITGAEPVDGPRGKPLHGPMELLRRSYQPYFTCGRNTDAGIQSCRILCDVRDRQHYSCIDDFCYCQTSYTFHNPANFEPEDTAPFFLCGRYTLDGYEKCVEECKKKPLATVQCGGPSCYCHFAASHPDVDLNGNPLPTAPNGKDETRSTLGKKPPNRIRASYCGRLPSPPLAGTSKTTFPVLPHPDINDRVNNCKYRCRGGKFTCTKRYCYCTSSGVLNAYK